MSTFTQTSTDNAGSDMPPALGGDDFTPGERAYFNSRGEDASGLGDTRAPASDTPAPGASGNARTDAPELEAAPDSFNADDVTLDDAGRARTKDGKFVKHVPYSVFKEKNEKYKEIASELMKANERFARADERLTVLNEAIAGKETKAATATADPDAPIDPEKDIFGAFKQAQQRLADLQKEIQQTRQTTTEAITEQQHFERFKSDATAFVQKQPDFGDAFNHLVSSRHTELEFSGMTDQAARDAQVTREAQALVRAALQAGKSPAAQIFALAKARGYQPKAATQQPAQAVDPSKSNAAAALETVNQNKAAAMSLNSAGGQPADRMTLQRLADMPDEEFQAVRATHIAKYGRPSWERHINGG